MSGVKTTYHIDHKGSGDSLVSPEFEAALKDEMEKEGIMPANSEVDENGEFRQIVEDFLQEANPAAVAVRGTDHKQAIIPGAFRNADQIIALLVEHIENMADQFGTSGLEAAASSSIKVKGQFLTKRYVAMNTVFTVKMEAVPAPPEKE
jgi:hypothetical protein